MKSFVEYLAESKKTYQFKIGIAGELPENVEDRLETAFQKYSLVNMSAGKRTPITERPLDFPQLQNTEVTYYEVEVNYPTTTQVLQEYLGQMCNIHQSHIIVRNANEPQEEYQQPIDDGPYETLLTKEDMGGESAQEQVGSNRVMDLLKELENARSERTNDPGHGGPSSSSTADTASTNNKSSIGN